ncbi:PP2C family protein-serine/threonine phosphatase [Inquilinus sp. NPDC058860]|uniref:PP2C family protein-serine/threonine phosphatase n=1 Tax=Inquilinus sp. NPDC058860 TaxID=3346652 RepID=UPI0036B0A960
MSGRLFHFHAAGRTDPGAMGTHNEDAFLSRADVGLWAVADGMGGHRRGDHASRTIMRALSQIPAPESAPALIGEVRERLASVHRILRIEAAEIGDGATIGSTVVVLMIHGGHFACLWAGDSRLYLLRDRQLWQISRDHSYVQDLIDSGILAPEEALHHPEANVITRAVGAAGELELDMEGSTVLPGDVFLLCSDGLTRVVADAEIANLLDAMPPEQAANTLVDLALGRGAPDNVTVVALACSEPFDTTPPARWSGP